MSVLDLRHTHRLVFRQTIFTIAFCVVIGFGMAFFPETFFNSKAYNQIIGELAIPQLWGAAWLACATIMTLGMTALSYKLTQIGLIAFSVISIIWALGLALLPVTSVNPAYTAAAIWGLIGVRTFVLALEPPINPATAIEIGKDGDDE